MSYQVIFTAEAHEEVDELAAYYAERFETGASDFLDALLDTVDALENNPFGYRVRFVDQRGFDRRGIKIKAAPGSRNYAKKFPYLVLYYCEESNREVVITEIFPTAFPESRMRGR